jgi:hypothetical protein
VVPFVTVHGLVQVWSGHTFFESAQAFNVWKTIHGMDWSNPPALGHAKALGIILEDPMLFVSSACNWLLFYSFYFVPLVGVIVLAVFQGSSGSHAVPRSLLSLAVAALLYLGVSAAGGSISAFTPVMPIVAVCVIPLIEFTLSRRSHKFQKRAISFIATIVWMVALTGFFIFTLHEESRVNDYAKIEQMLNIHSRSDALDIYTDDFDFYFPGSGYQAPRTTGGWGEVGLPNYLREFPHIHNTSAEAEHHDLIAHGIQWAIYRIPPYDPLGYEGVKNDTAHFRLVYRTPFHEIYHIQ